MNTCPYFLDNQDGIYKAYMGIQDYLKSSNPLSEEAMDFLIEYKEEDQYVDYKEDFDSKSEKEWIGITKDAMAFANTCGGYLVFGVQDVTYKLLGLKAETVKILDDITRIHSKLNRYISPHITSLRTRPHIKDDKTFVIFCIPESIGKTHIVIKEALLPTEWVILVNFHIGLSIDVSTFRRRYSSSRKP